MNYTFQLAPSWVSVLTQGQISSKESYPLGSIVTLVKRQKCTLYYTLFMGQYVFTGEEQTVSKYLMTMVTYNPAAEDISDFTAVKCIYY